MTRQAILRPCFNRPEMLQISIGYEINARQFYPSNNMFTTLFVVEYGYSPEILNIIKDYPYEKEVVIREQPHGLTANILEGYKRAFSIADSFVITIEDDVLIHESYFQYIDAILSCKDLPKFSCILAWGQKAEGDTRVIRKAHHYGPWAPLLDKYFFEKYVEKHANRDYYSNRAAKVLELNKNYIQHFESGRYKFNTAVYNEQAGLINRLVDHAMIDEDMYVLTPEVPRQRNIGYYGQNRHGGYIPGKTFTDRVNNLTNIITDPNKMCNLAKSDRFGKDYILFSEELSKWDGSIQIV